MNRNLGLSLVSLLVLGACSDTEVGADKDKDGYISPIEASTELSKLTSAKLAPGLWEITSDSPALRGSGTIESCLSPERARMLEGGILMFDDWTDPSRFPSQRCEFTQLQVSDSKVGLQLNCGEATESYEATFAAEEFEIRRSSDLMSINVESSGRRLGLCDASNDEL